MKVTVIALDSFAHGNRQYVAGDPVEVTKGEADEMLKHGLVKEQEEEPEQQSDEAQKPIESQKMDEPASNKMDKPTANKGRKASKEAD